MAPVGRAVGAQNLHEGEKEVGRASCVRGKMGAERRRDVDSGRKRFRARGAFSGGVERTGRKGLVARERRLRNQGRAASHASFRER